MIDDALNMRRGAFKWYSKQELCDYFEIRHGLSRKLIEAEIALARKSFKLRKGEAIRTTELWQKAGLAMEKKIRDIDLDK
jgi:hypothetical protein